MTRSNSLEQFVHTPRIAYFSMEIGLRSEIPTYSGGLGVLAGDTLRSAADLKIPLVGVTLISRQGHFRQVLDVSGRQSELPEPWQPEHWAVPLPAKISVPVADRDVWVQAWLYVLTGSSGYEIPVLLLDTDLPENAPADRRITDQLYGDGAEYRLTQEIVLGIGGARTLQALDFHVHTYHMNEGHSALLALELLRRGKHRPERQDPLGEVSDVAQVREQCLFTTHTPIEAGHDQFDYGLADRLMARFISPSELRRLAGNQRLNMTRLALRLSGYVNGVAKTHAEVSQQMFPEYHVHAITNGVHPGTWTAQPLQRLFDQRIPGWRYEPDLLVRADQIPANEIWEAHSLAKLQLIESVRERCGIVLDAQTATLGFARRMTAYKRPDLLFSDLHRLRRIAERWPIQIVMAGKAHPKDVAGKALIERIFQMKQELSGMITLVFLPNYDMQLGHLLTSGVDVWLNTPLRPLEASGTSGMKAALNGVPNLSVLDGWWTEGCIEGVTGWAVGNSGAEANGQDADALYTQLEDNVLPLYYTDRAGWVRVMLGAIAKNGYFFNSHRMMRRYATAAYIR
ncbi:alpha-glucan family phosphorylase [Thioalkalivibrio sulfidiphilus]|uniref:alpha-glucan family phosphorylase n=1 Tax=Thioalkalivibrio sulfidiphilus TaxID=1033854 RepID=UPI0003789C70|nr:alpha-glucan family phosphorylase [Thioalkalivibrio sulfidiphilus]